MKSRSASTLASEVRERAMQTAVHALPFAQYTPLRNVMAVSLLVEQFDAE